MLRDKMIDHWVEELDREIYDLLDIREEVAGERFVIDDGADKQDAMTAPSDGIKTIHIPLEKINDKSALEVLEATQINIDYASAIERLRTQQKEAPQP